MKSYLIDSVPRRLCNHTEEDILENLESCRDCGEIPIPTYRTYKDKAHSYCKKCYYLRKYDDKSLNQQTKPELNMLNKLKIRCKFFEKGCSEVFCVNTLKELLDHQFRCTYSDLFTLNMKESRLLSEEIKIKCKKCDYIHQDTHDCFQSIRLDNRDIITLLEKIDKGFTIKLQKLLINNEVMNEKMALSQSKLEENKKEIEKISEKYEKIDKKLDIIIEKLSKTDENNDKIKEDNKLVPKHNDDFISNFINLDEKLNKTVNKCEEIFQSSLKINKNIKISNKIDKCLLDLEQKFDNYLENNKLNIKGTETILSNFHNNIQRDLEMNSKNINSSIDSVLRTIKNNKFYLNKNNYIIPCNWDYDYENYIKLGEHEKTVWSIIQISDNLLVTCSDDKSIKLWEIDSKKTIKSFENNSEIYSITKLSDVLIACGCKDHNINIVSLTNGNLIHQLKGHSDSIMYVVRLSNGKLASCSGDKTVRIWDYNNYENIQVLSNHSNIVWHLCELSDGRLASVSEDQTIKIWKTNYQLENTINAHEGPVYSVIEITDDTIASAGRDKLIKIWRISNKECILSLSGHINDITCLLILSDGRLVSSSSDKFIKLWDLRRKECIQTLKGHNHYVRCLIELSDKRLASVSWDKSIFIWN
jgi:WD40 repeat protein